MENDVTNNGTRAVGEGTFSIGSAVKGGYLSIKIDLNDIERTKTSIQLLQELYSWIQLQEEVKRAVNA